MVRDSTSTKSTSLDSVARNSCNDTMFFANTLDQLVYSYWLDTVPAEDCRICMVVFEILGFIATLTEFQT